MATFVIVHGGWGGGWEWTPVARLLRQRGHEVFTPTLTGMGERAHLGGEIRLSDHIEDVQAVLSFEELEDVVLCGQSYGGMVVTGVADRVPELVRLLVYLDAFAPRDGQALKDFVPELVEPLLQIAGERGDGRAPLPRELAESIPDGRVPEPRRASFLARLRPHPMGTMTEPVRLTGAVERLPRAFVRCTGGEGADGEEIVAPFAARARAEGWHYREIATPHDLQLYDPDGTAAVLHELAAGR